MAAVAIGVALTAPALSAEPSPDLFRAIAAADLRLETIGYRLATANVARCTQRAGASGIVLADLDAYGMRWRDAAIRAFGAGEGLAIEAVVPGSPAAASGVAAGDTLVAIEGVPARGERLADAAPDQPLALTVRRAGDARPLRIVPRPACRVRFRLMLGKRFAANADATTVRIGAGFVERLPDARLAAVVAHELAHVILGHAYQRRGDGTRGGVAGEIGAAARTTRAREDDADRLSLRLMAAAGYDPAEAVALWREDGALIQGWLPRGPSHRGWQARAEWLAAALAALPR